MKNTEKWELKALNSPQKSFYKKAHIIAQYDEIGITKRLQLQSYNTIICTITFHDTHTFITVPKLYSRTSNRHLMEFLIQQYGVLTANKIMTLAKQGERAWNV